MIGNKPQGGDILRVPDQAARIALPTPYYGYVYQVDIDALYSWSLTLSQWIVVNSGVGAFTINGLSLPDHVIEFDGATTETEPTVTSADIAGIATHKLIIPSAAVSGVTAGLISNTDYELLHTLGDTVHEYEVFDSISSGTAGTVNKPAHGTVVFNQYEDGGDCLIVKVDTNGRPVDDPARDSSGNIITGTIDASGNYTISAAPSGYPVALVWQVQLAERWKSAELTDDRIINETELPIAARVTFDDSASLTGADNVQGAVEYICTVPTMYHGVVTLPAITDNGDGSVNLGAGVANFYVDADGDSVCVRLPIPAAAPVLLSDMSVNYIYADYNAGAPTVSVTTSPNAFISDGRLVPLFRIVREGNELCILDYDEYGIALADKHYFKDVVLRGAERSTGLVLSTAPTRISTIGAGSAYFGVTLKTLAENVAGVDTLCEFYLVAGVWTKATVAAYDSAYYSDGTNRQSLSPNRWVAKYFYRSIGAANQAAYIHGNQYTSAAAALAEAVPAAPATLAASSLYVGKIVIQQGAADGTAYPRLWEGAVSTAGAVNHNDLANRDEAGSHAKIVPLADSITAFQVTKADGTTIMLNADTINDVLKTGIAGYENNITADNDIPNKKYTDNSAIKYAIALG